MLGIRALAQRITKYEIWCLQSVPKQGKEERECLEVELVVAQDWVLNTQESLSKLQESQDLLRTKNEELRGCWSST